MAGADAGHAIDSDGLGGAELDNEYQSLAIRLEPTSSKQAEALIPRADTSGGMHATRM